MSGDSVIDLSTPEARSLTYGRLAQAFVYPQKGQETLISAVEYTEAFDPAASAVGCSLREYAYRKDIHPTSLNEELLRFYHFFGVTRSGEAVMPDHISIELEFLQFLNDLEAGALARGEDVTPLKKAQRDFLHRHVAVLARGVLKVLRSEYPSCRTLVEMAVEVTATDLQRLENEVGLAGDAAA